MLIWEVLETLSRWGRAGGSGSLWACPWGLVTSPVLLSVQLSSFWLWSEQPVPHGPPWCVATPRAQSQWGQGLTEDWRLWDWENTNPFPSCEAHQTSYHNVRRWTNTSLPTKIFLDNPIWIAQSNTRHYCHIGKQFGSPRMLNYSTENNPAIPL